MHPNVGVTIVAGPTVLVDCHRAGIAFNLANEGLSHGDWIIGFRFTRGGSISTIGGMIAVTNSRLDIVNCSFTDSCESGGSGKGAAVGSQNGAVSIRGSNFTNNVANGAEGGAVYYICLTQPCEGMTIIGSTFTSNSANCGGAVRMVGSSLLIENSVFDKNIGYFGGAVSVFGNVTVIDCTFTYNSAYYLGGALAGENYNGQRGITTITRGYFDRNMIGDPSATQYSGGGGAIWIQDADALLDRVHISGSFAGGIGGGIYVNVASLRMYDSTVIGNVAYSGGGVFLNGSTSYVMNTTFARNEAYPSPYGAGGVMYAAGSTYSFLSCPMYCNNATTAAGSAFYTVDTVGATNSGNIIHNHAYGTTVGYYPNAMNAPPQTYDNAAACDRGTLNLDGSCSVDVGTYQPSSSFCGVLHNYCQPTTYSDVACGSTWFAPIGMQRNVPCCEGYSAVNSTYAVTCQPDGTWSASQCYNSTTGPPPPPPPALSPPPPPPVPQPGCGPFPVPSNAGIGDCSGAADTSCTAVCSNGYGPVNGASLTRTCQNGTWVVANSGAANATCGLCAAACASCSVAGAADKCLTCVSGVAGGNDCAFPVAIVAGAAGGIALALILLLVICLCRRRRRQHEQQLASENTAIVGTDVMSRRMDNLLKGAKRLGKGGAGEVFKATLENGEQVAIKKLVAKDHRMVSEFHREVNILSRLGGDSHPNVIRLLFFSADPPCIALELAEQGSLRSMTQAGANHEEMMRQVAEGMVFLHQHFIVHLDLKPDNILIAEGGVMKITDFGASMEINETGQAIESTDTIPFSSFSASSNGGSIGRGGKKLVTDGFTGTPQFAAPERFLSPLRCDLRCADVFSFGVMAWSVVTGERPLVGETPDTLVVHYTSDLTFPAGVLPMGGHVPQRLRQAVESCIKREPKQRPTFASLVSFLSGMGQQLDLPRSYVNEQPTQLMSTTPNGSHYNYSSSPATSNPSFRR